MLDLKEVLVVNCIAVLMMIFLLRYRYKHGKNPHADSRIYSLMAFITLLGAIAETGGFLVDGYTMACGRFLNYLFNSLSFLGTSSIGLLWCFYVDLHVNKNYKRTFRIGKFLAIPWLLEVAAIIANAAGVGILFTISDDNVYSRATWVGIGYLTLIFYFACSMYIVNRAERQVLHLNFFPIQYFLLPCLAGVITQFIWYGITTSWISVAIALTFVQMQSDSENLLMDALSGLYNRRYLNGILQKKDIIQGRSLFGIMFDVNDFKSINDNFGHAKGDQAIRVIGDILFKSMPDGGMPIRYAGDEFVVLLSNVSQEKVNATIAEINANIAAFNASSAEPFKLSIAIGQARLGLDENVEEFLSNMDAAMYEEKRKYHMEHK